MSDNSKIAAVVLAGLAAGAAAWYLLGTEEGKENLDKLANSIKDIGGSLKDLTDKADIAGTFNDLKEKASETIGSMASKAPKVAENIAQEVTPAY